MQTLRLITIIAFSALLLDACSIYRVKVQQGNVVTAKELAEVHKGMDKMQVSALLGSPVLKDPWYPDRWVYVYSLKPAYGNTQVRKVILNFNKEGALENIQGDVTASKPAA